MDVKKPYTFKEQLKKIESRGCTVSDETAAVNFLRQINYYRLTAYFLPFKCKNDTYKPGTTFEKVCSIYEFDRKMRSIVLPVVEEIELMLRTQLSYYHAHKYGALGYLDANNFNHLHKHDVFLEHIEHTIKNNEKLLFVQHHMEQYEGRFPIWVIVELFSMGELSFFYSDMLRDDRKKIACDVFQTYDRNLSSWLMCLTLLRNYCAHYSRLYYFLFPAIPTTPEGFPYTLWKRLFDYLLMLKFLYRDQSKWNNQFMVQLSSLIEEYEGDISLRHIGFPNNWKLLLEWKLKTVNGRIEFP